MNNIKITLSTLLFVTFYSFAQTGVGTTDPKATFDVVGKPTDSNVLDGIIAPRITGNELSAKNYTTAQTGATVYVTQAATSLTGQVVNVSSAGIYFYDGSVWIKAKDNVVANNGLSKTNDNIQLGGTLLRNTEIVSAGFSTSFSGTGKVGIGTNNPFSQFSNSATAAANDNSGRGINVSTGLNWNSSGDGYSIILTNSNTTGTGSGLFIKTNSPDNLSRPLHIMSGTSNVLTATGLGRVGVGIIQPTNNLHVSAAANPLRLEGLQNGENTDQLLSVDANGVVKKSTVNLESVVQTSAIAERNSSAGTFSPNVYRKVTFTNIPVLRNLTHTSGTFTATKAGYYQLNGSIVADVSMNTDTDGTTILVFYKNTSTVSATVSFSYLSGISHIEPEINRIIYLGVGETVHLEWSFTRTARLDRAQFSAVYLGL